MKESDLTFGKIILEARRRKGLKLKECAPLILKEDNTSISIQYLNDIENGRRKPPAEFIVKQLSELLDIPIEVLYFYAGIFPKTLEQNLDQKQIIAAYKDFVKTLSQKVTA
jgi:transcriptional regulator with XRE-family HTH domain